MQEGGIGYGSCVGERGIPCQGSHKEGRGAAVFALDAEGLKQTKTVLQGWKNEEDWPPDRMERSGGERLRSRDLEFSSAPQPSGLLDQQAGIAGARPAGKVENSDRQTVLGAVVHDEAFFAGAADRQVGGAFGALGALDDLLAELIEGGRRASGLESALERPLRSTQGSCAVLHRPDPGRSGFLHDDPFHI